MAGLMVAPICPECECRTTKLRFDTDDHIGVVSCDDCDKHLMAVSVLANRKLKTVKDPRAGELPEGVYHDLEKRDRLPPVITGGRGDA